MQEYTEYEVDTSTGEVHDTSGMELTPVNETSLEQFISSNEPVHVQALGMHQNQPLKELMKKTKMLTSYIGVPKEDMKNYINNDIDVMGAIIYHVDKFISKSDGQVKPGYDQILIKLTDKNKKGSNIVLACYGKLVFELVRNVLLPYFGWYDWIDQDTGEPFSIRFRVTKDDYGYHLEQLD